MLGKKFNAEGGVKGCLDFVDWCRGVNALVSSKGIAVCMVIDYGVDDWRPGFGYKWGDSLPTPYFSGCSLGPYREKLNRAPRGRARGADRSTVPAGLPGTAFVATGAGAPPKITLVGPKGERISTPDDLMPVEAKPFLLMKNPQANLTQVAIIRPSAGEWKVIVEDGSAPVDLAEGRRRRSPAEDRRQGHRQGRPAQAQLRRHQAARPDGHVHRARPEHRRHDRRREQARRRAALPPRRRRRARSARSSRSSSRTGMVTDQLVVGHYRAPKVYRPGLVKGVKAVQARHPPGRVLEGHDRRRALRRDARAVRRPPGRQAGLDPLADPAHVRARQARHGPRGHGRGMSAARQSRRRRCDRAAATCHSRRE